MLCSLAMIGTMIIGLSLSLYGAQDNATYTEDALIVLGAGINKTTPGPTLKGRLDTAVSYHKRNPSALIIVSGGQGPQEDITEAIAMRDHLVFSGVDESVIILEEEATSSYENFLFSKGLLDLYLGDEYTVAFVTNEYHVYRAELYATAAGLDSVTHVHSSTPTYIIIPNMLREFVATAKALLID